MRKLHSNLMSQRSGALAPHPSLVCVCLLIGLGPASAYRPFDGTDAAVADKDKFEIELQPAGLLKDASGKTLIAPAARFNYGYTENWEAVLEGQFENPLSPSGPASLRAAGAFLKGVLREGSLQDKTGPSVATEFGVLLPDSQGPLPVRRKPGRHRVAALGLGSNSPERCRGAHP